MALSAVRGRATARWAGVSALILGLAVAAAPPAAGAGLPHALGPAQPAFPAGLWRPADGSGAWGPLKAARPRTGLPAPVAGPAAPGRQWQAPRRPHPGLS